MAITVADNFSYQGKKPLDGRDTFATLAAMKAYAEASVYDGCLSYCDEDGKRYEFKSTNTVDPTTGKWREYSSGGGGETYNDFTGATSSTAGVHGLVPAPSAGDEGKVLFGNGAWGNIEMPSVDYSQQSNEANIFSATEKVIGQWTDGKLLYAKTVTGTVPTGSAWFDIPHGISNIDKVCFSKIGMVSSTGSYITIGGADESYSKLYGMVSKSNIGLCIVPNNDYKGYSIIATVFYTKTTDSPLPSGVKFAGVTASGEVIYKQTISTTFASGLIHTITDTNIIPYRLQANMHTNNKSVMSDGFIYNTNNYWSIWVDDRKIYGVNGGTSYAGRAIDIDLYYTLAS